MARKENENKRFLKVSVELLDLLDCEKTFELQLAMTLLFQVKPQYEWYGDTIITTTPSLLIKYFGNYTDMSRRQAENVINSLIDMRDRGLIQFKADKVTFQTELTINVKPLLELADKGKQFVKITNEDFITIMIDDEPLTTSSKKQPQDSHSTMLWMYFSSTSCFNWKNINYLVDNFDKGEVARDITDDKRLQELKYVFCNASIDELRFRKHNTLKLDKCICCNDYASACMTRLVELGILKVQKRGVVDDNRTYKDMNFYYLPIIHDENMEVIVCQWAKRHNYVIKNVGKKQTIEQEEKEVVIEQPRQDKQDKQDDVFSRRRRFR